MDNVFEEGGGGGGVVFARAPSVSDRQVASQMATPSADPCLALAGAQLARGVGHTQPREEICGLGDHMASVTSLSHSSPPSVSPPLLCALCYLCLLQYLRSRCHHFVRCKGTIGLLGITS